MDILIKLILAVIAYFLASWLLALTALPEVFVTLLSLLVACLVFVSSPNRFNV